MNEFAVVSHRGATQNLANAPGLHGRLGSWARRPDSVRRAPFLRGLVMREGVRI